MRAALQVAGSDCPAPDRSKTCRIKAANHCAASEQQSGETPSLIEAAIAATTDSPEISSRQMPVLSITRAPPPPVLDPPSTTNDFLWPGLGLTVSHQFPTATSSCLTKRPLIPLNYLRHDACCDWLTRRPARRLISRGRARVKNRREAASGAEKLAETARRGSGAIAVCSSQNNKIINKEIKKKGEAERK